MREKYEEQFQQFERDIEKHTVTVLRDDGLYRHIRCSRGSYVYSFDVLTWPGYLCYTGDMGCFVFSRLPDMFQFFRGRRDAVVDRGYFAEKAVACDKHDGITAYSEESFKAIVKERFEEFAEDLTEEERADLWRDITDEILSVGSDGRHVVVEAAMQFRWRKQEVFTDFWEHSLEEYTTRFWWCCYAIPWAIERYDALKIESPLTTNAVDPVGEKVTG